MRFYKRASDVPFLLFLSAVIGNGTLQLNGYKVTFSEISREKRCVNMWERNHIINSNDEAIIDDKVKYLNFSLSSG